MKAFIFAYWTNFGLGACIVYAHSKEEAIELAKDTAWEIDNVYEIDLTIITPKVVIIGDSDFHE